LISPPNGHEVIRMEEEGNALHLRLDFMPAPSDGRAENTEYQPLENGAGEEDGVIK